MIAVFALCLFCIIASGGALLGWWFGSLGMPSWGIFVCGFAYGAWLVQMCRAIGERRKESL